MDRNIDSRDLTLLVPAFGAKVTQLLSNCAAKGVVMKPFFTMRGPEVQAKLWCQSRTVAQVAAESARLTAEGAPWLAAMLKPELAARGAEVTKALPGSSWHQWGEAVDCFVQGSNGQAVWNAGDAGYRIYANEALALHLDAGFKWTRFKDAPHVQLRKAGSPLSLGMTWAQIETEMKARFS
jgi:peptidoglycan LD-endopeptidase CwlK